MKTLSECYLYGILDLGYVVPADAVAVARQMIAGGVDILQLRAKRLEPADLLALARLIRPPTAQAGVLFIVNDFPAIAAQAGADGVHIGQEDGPLEAARAAPLVGRSTHSVAQARAAGEEGADYLGFGPLFATPTKPDYAPVGLGDIARVEAEIGGGRPVFCIGGIKLENLPEVIAAGARRAVIVSGLLLAPDIAGYARQARELLVEAAGSAPSRPPTQR